MATSHVTYAVFVHSAGEIKSKDVMIRLECQGEVLPNKWQISPDSVLERGALAALLHSKNVTPWLEKPADVPKIFKLPATADVLRNNSKHFFFCLKCFCQR